MRHQHLYFLGVRKINGLENGTPVAAEWGVRCFQGKRVGPMKLSFDNTAYRLWLQEIMKQFVLTMRPGTNHWYLSHSIV